MTATAKQIIDFLVEDQLSTLVIHKQDPTTDFLTPIYAGLGYPVVTGNMSAKELFTQIKEHDRIYMMGHGSPYGMFGPGYLIDDRFGPELAKKRDGLYIWCYAEVYARKHKLNGLVSGMFISEVGEAAANGIRATQQEVDASNDMFARIVREYLDTGVSPHHVKQCYTNATCQITNFNNDRMFVMEGGVPLKPDGTPAPEPKQERPVQQARLSREVEDVLDLLYAVEDGYWKPVIDPADEEEAERVIELWQRSLNKERILDELNTAETPQEALANILVKTGLYGHASMFRSHVMEYIVVRGLQVLQSSSG